MEGLSSWRDDEEACVPWVLCTQQAPLERGWVAGESVGDHHSGRLRLPVQPAAEKALGRLLVAPLKDFRHRPVAVDGPPQPVLRPRARATHRVRVPAAPARARRRSSAATIRIARDPRYRGDRFPAERIRHIV